MAKDPKDPEYEAPRLQLQVVESAGPDSDRREIPSYSRKDRKPGKKKPAARPWMIFPGFHPGYSYGLDEMINSPYNTEMH